MREEMHEEVPASRLEDPAKAEESFGRPHGERADPASGELVILWSDADLVVVDKPSGLAVHRGWARDKDVALARLRDQLGQRVYPVHRLDRGTSGALLFALSPQVAAAAQAALAGGEDEASAPTKRYLALVRGITEEEGTIDHPIPRQRKSRQRVDAVTDFRRLGVFERFSLVEARPRTGRTHQIRRHMKHRSWPLVGDVHYGKGEINRHFRQRFGLHRLALHALELGFRHPLTGMWVSAMAEVPADLAVPWQEMGFGPLLAALYGSISESSHASTSSSEVPSGSPGSSGPS